MNPRTKYEQETGHSSHRYLLEDGTKMGATPEYIAWLEKQYTLLTSDNEA